MSELYKDDILLWSEHQGELLRRRAADELVKEAELAWPNIAEEIESVSREQLHAVEPFIVQALLHDLKARAWPLSRGLPNWLAEARRFRGDAASRFLPSMRQRIDLAKVHRRALRATPETIDDQPPLPICESCPMKLDKLLADD
jgi:hypothetical protein